MEAKSPGFRGGVAAAAGWIALVALATLTPAIVRTQEQFQFVVSARDAGGRPVVDLRREEIVMLENGVANEIVKVEPFHIPVKLTIAVDNGIHSRNALVHYRAGLEGLIRKLPPDMEVALLSTAPQPRFVVRPTMDRVRLLRGINAFVPEDATPRFADTLVEFSKRLQEEFYRTKRFDSLPVILLVSTTAGENYSYRATEINTALDFLSTRKTRVYVAMTTTGIDPTTDAGHQPTIAIPLVKATNGRYEALSNTSRLMTLLPEFGDEIAALHQRRNNQLLVTASRQEGLRGPLQNPRIELTRSNLKGQVSLDGLPPN